MQFTDILGQEQALHILCQAISHHQVAHAYLFSGPEGVGKKKTALALAQYLNCAQPDKQLNSCGVCPSCVQAASGNYPDLFLVEPDGATIKIEQIRSLLNKLSLRSYAGGYQIVIIDQAHTMTEQAANCLLKTLEEPPANTVFCLITSQSAMLPITIISRCQQLQFHPLAPEVVRQVLQTKYPEKQSRIGLVTALAKGSLYTAEEILNNEEFTEARTNFYELLARLTSLTPADILLWCEQWDKNRKMVAVLLELCQLWYHDALLLTTAKKQDLLINQDYLAAFGQLKLTPAQALQILEACQTAVRQLDSNATPRLTLSVLLLKIQTILKEV